MPVCHEHRSACARYAYPVRQRLVRVLIERSTGTAASSLVCERSFWGHQAGRIVKVTRECNLAATRRLPTVMRVTISLALLSLVGPGCAQNSDSIGGKQGVDHGTGQACICHTADCTGLEPSETNGCKAGQTINVWLPTSAPDAVHQCPTGVLTCPCETSDGAYVNANTEEECTGKSQGLSQEQVDAMIANGVNPAKHECGCCHCNAIAGGGTELDKTCDEGHVEAWNPDVHVCDNNFWVVVFVVLTLIAGGAAGVYLTKRKKAQMAAQELEDKQALDSLDS